MGTATVFQWNARSLVAHAIELKHFISTSQIAPDVICIQESWLKKDLNFTLVGYNVIRREREDGYVGVVTCIKTGISYDVITNPTNMEVLIVKVKLLTRDLYIINVYHPLHAALDTND